MDMSKAFIAGAAQHLPKAAIAFDGFHVVQRANRAVDAVRREEPEGERWSKKNPLVVGQGTKPGGQTKSRTRWIGCPTPD